MPAAAFAEEEVQLQQPEAESTARSGRKDTWREANQKHFFWEHEKSQPTKTFIVPCRLCHPTQRAVSSLCTA